MNRSRARLRTAAVILALIGAACGGGAEDATELVSEHLTIEEATDDPRGGSVFADDRPPGSSVGPATTSSEQASTAPDDGAPAGPATTGGEQAPSGSGGAPPPDGGTGAPPPPPPGTGPNEPSGEPVVIGLEYLGDAENISAYFGGNVQTGDSQAQGRAVADWINANGGVAGRPLELVFHATETADVYNDRAGMSEKACVTFTEDHDVVAAGVLYTHENLISCLHDAGVFSAATLYPLDESQMTEYAGSFSMPGALNATRATRTMIRELVASGDLPKDAQVGLGYEDTPPFRRLAEETKAELAKYGIEVVAEFAENRDSFSTVPAQNQNAVINFRRRGVTHVLFADRGGSVALYFMLAAENQAWYPRYALATHNSMNVLALYAPEGQLANASGVSSFHGDVESFRNGDNGTAALCLSIFDQAGVSTGDPQSAAEQLGVNFCDWLLYFKALGDATGQVGAGPWSQAIRSGSFRYESAVAYRSAFPGNRFDGAAGVRVVGWDRGVGDWVWKSDVIAVD